METKFRLGLFCVLHTLGLNAQMDTVFNESKTAVEIITQKNTLFSTTSGTVHSIKDSVIRELQPLSTQEVIRKLPGVYSSDEDGAGLRSNIGFRGLDPDRSRNILVLEDGIPVALAPYGEPELYFTPSVDKVSSIDIVKGSSQLRFGPQTIGGVLNYKTAPIPKSSLGTLRMTGGLNGYGSLFASYGASKQNNGFLVSYFHKRADALGNLNFRINDFSFKYKYQTSSSSQLQIKAGLYDEQSNATYVGLTQSIWDQGQHFAVLTPDDVLKVRRYHLSALHQWQINSRLSVEHLIYSYHTQRDWQRQDYSFSKTASNKTGVYWGDTSIANGAIYLLNSNGHRNRQFDVLGAEQKLVYDYDFLKGTHHLDFGIRYVQEKAYEQFIVGKKATAQGGDLRDDELRTGKAWSLFLHQNSNFNEKWVLNYGVRLEHFNYERAIYRGRFTINSSTQVRDTNLVTDNSVTAIIPGVGFNYNPSQHFTVLGGVHKGFAPPRIKDAITSEGKALELKAEESWNYELGFRSQFAKAFQVHMTLFVLDFKNKIVAASLSSGNATGLTNAGKTLHRGVELESQIELHTLLGWKKQFILENNLTVQKATFNQDYYQRSGTDTINIKGFDLPYAPQLMYWGSVSIEPVTDFMLRFSAHYTSKQFADDVNTEAGSTNGRIGTIEARWLFDATVRYTYKNFNFDVAVKNILDQRYIASRRPEGIRAGLPRMLTTGISMKF